MLEGNIARSWGRSSKLWAPGSKPWYEAAPAPSRAQSHPEVLCDPELPQGRRNPASHHELYILPRQGASQPQVISSAHLHFPSDKTLHNSLQLTIRRFPSPWMHVPFHSTGLLRVDLRHRATIRFYLLEGQIIIAPGCICKTLHLHPMKKTFTRSAQLINHFVGLLLFMLVAWEMEEENM